MIFKDRGEAGKLLAEKIGLDNLLPKQNLLVVSLLRGGVITGQAITDHFRAFHLPLPVAKISSSQNQELAIGGLCFDVVYLEKRLISALDILKPQIKKQINIARHKFTHYLERYNLDESLYQKKVISKIVVLTDDGIATGATIRAAYGYLSTLKPVKIIVAVPVAPLDFDERGFDRLIILHREAYFSAVSQFYKDFPQVEDEEVLKIIKGIKNKNSS